MSDITLAHPDSPAILRALSEELGNFQDIAKYLIPQAGETPRLQGIDVWGRTLPLNGSVGGDHIVYVDFKQRFDLDARIARAIERNQSAIVDNLKRCQHAAGIAVVDVAGHRMTDALLAAMFHQAFLVGATYELDLFGMVTQRVFEHLNTRFYQSSGAHKFISLLYGEISENARFRFISLGHPFPTVFSRQHNRIMDVTPDLRVSFPPLGMQPSLHVIDRNRLGDSLLGFKDRYETSEWWLMGSGDILLLHTDGLTEHTRGEEHYFPERLEDALRAAKHGTAREIVDALQADLLDFATLADDVSLVVIKLA